MATQSQELLLRTAVEHIDNILQKKPNGLISKSMITDSLQQTPTPTICPREVFATLIDQHGDEALNKLPSFFKGGGDEEEDGVFIHKQPANKATLATVDRLWKWLCGSGKRELLKAKTLESALKVIKPFCVLKPNSGSNDAGGVSVSDDVRSKLEEMTNDFNKFKTNKEEEENQSAMVVDLEFDFEDAFARCCFFGRKSIVTVLAFSVRKQFNYETQFAITPVASKRTTVNIEARPAVSPSPINDTLSYFLNRKYLTSELQTKLETRSRMVAKLLEPIAFAKVAIPICDVGRFIGKRGSSINAVKAQLETIVIQKTGLERLGFMLSLSILKENATVTSPPIVTVGVWVTHESALEDMCNNTDLSFAILKVVLGDALKAALKANINATMSAHRQNMAHTNRLPHLIELSSFSHISDKERARKGRYEKEKAKWKKMRILNIREPRNHKFATRSHKSSLKKRDLWPVKGMKDIILCPDVDIDVGGASVYVSAKQRRELKLLEKAERRKQFYALKAAKGSGLKRTDTEWNHCQDSGLSKHRNKLDAHRLRYDTSI